MREKNLTPFFMACIFFFTQMSKLEMAGFCWRNGLFLP